MSVLEVRKCLTDFMISIALLIKSGKLNCVDKLLVLLQPMGIYQQQVPMVRFSMVTGILILISSLTCLKEAKIMVMILCKYKLQNSFPYLQ